MPKRARHLDQIHNIDYTIAVDICDVLSCLPKVCANDNQILDVHHAIAVDIPNKLWWFCNFSILKLRCRNLAIRINKTNLG